MSTLIYFRPQMCTCLSLWLVVSMLAQKTAYCTSVNGKARRFEKLHWLCFYWNSSQLGYKVLRHMDRPDPKPGQWGSTHFCKDGILPVKSETIKIKVFPLRVLNEAVETSPRASAIPTQSEWEEQVLSSVMETCRFLELWAALKRPFTTCTKC